MLFKIINKAKWLLLGRGFSRVKQGYLIEVRVYGPAKQYARQITYEISRKFGVRGAVKRRVVPHITLYGPFATSNPGLLFSTFQKVCKKYSITNPDSKLMYLRIGKPGSFQGASGRVINFEITPSGKFLDFTREMKAELNRFCRGQRWDAENDEILHLTLAFKDVNSKHRNILSYLESKNTPTFTMPLIRIALIGPGRKIVYEYDLVQDRMLNRNEALSKENYWLTIEKLKRINRGI